MHSIIIDSKLGYDKLSANDATSEPECNKKSDGSEDARRGFPNILNYIFILDQKLSGNIYMLLALSSL